ncbi:MAG: hypothetical protein V1787_02885 [Candidatus Micrarchaeota archaeon]
MEEEHLQALQALGDELSQLKEELREARSGSGEGFLKRASELGSSLDLLTRSIAGLEESRISELSSLRNDIRSFRGDIAAVRAGADALLSSQLSGLGSRLDGVAGEISEARESSEVGLSEISDLRKEIASLHEQVMGLREEMKAAAESSYSAVRAFEGLHSSSKSSVSADVAALSHEMTGVSQSVAAHSHQLSALVSKAESIESHAAAVHDLRKSFESGRSLLSEVDSKLSASLSALASQKADLDSEARRAQQFEELALSMQNELSAFAKDMAAQSRALDSLNATIPLLKNSTPAADSAALDALAPQLVSLKAALEYQSGEFAALRESVSSLALAHASSKSRGMAPEGLSRKMDSLSQSVAHANENLASISTQLAGSLPMAKDLDASAYNLFREAGRMQSAFLAVQDKIAGLHASKSDLSSIEFQLEQLTGEMRQLQKRSQHSAAPLASLSPASTPPPALPPAGLKPLAVELSRLRSEFHALSLKMSAGCKDPAPDLSRALSPVLKEMQSISRKVEAARPQPAMPSVDLSPVIRSIDALHSHISSFSQDRPAPVPEQAAEFGALRTQLEQLSASVAELKSQQATAAVDLSPVLSKLEEIKYVRPAAAAVPDEAFTKPVLQRAVLEEIQQELSVFESFDLSDRAKLVVNRLNSLAEKGLGLAK